LVSNVNGDTVTFAPALASAPSVDTPVMNWIRVDEFWDVTVENGTQTTIIIEDGSIYHLNVTIVIDNDDIPRLVTQIDGDTITFSPGLGSASMAGTFG
jgi:preprotein translocase subunit Sec63